MGKGKRIYKDESMKIRNLEHSDNWATPNHLYKKLDDEFHFDFDPCPLNHDTTEWDGLVVNWGDRNFVNPPYSEKLKGRFVKKALQESKKGKLCVLLLPVSTSTRLFHNAILPNANEIRFIKGRVPFTGFNTKGEYVTNQRGMHDSMVVVMDGRIKSDRANNLFAKVIGSNQIEMDL